MSQYACASLCLLSLLPAKEAKRASRPKDPFGGIGTHAMLPSAHAEENGLLVPLRQLAVFLTHASPPLHNAADSEPSLSPFVGSYRNRGCAREDGFNRRVSISVHVHNGEYSNSLLAPKVMTCAAGIESARYDFERFLWLLSFLERK